MRDYLLNSIFSNVDRILEEDVLTRIKKSKNEVKIKTQTDMLI